MVVIRSCWIFAPNFKPKDLHVAWNVQYVVVFVPAQMIPPIARRESVKSTDSGSVTGIKSIRTTCCQGTSTKFGQETPEPMHSLRLMIKEEALIISDSLLSKR